MADFKEFLDDVSKQMHCPNCRKPFDKISYEINAETSDLHLHIECHGDIFDEVITKEELKELDDRRARNLAAEVRMAAQPTSTTNQFNKFKRLK